MEANRDKIAELFLETSSFNSNDILVHVGDSQVHVVPADCTQLPYGSIKDLIRKSQLSIKESGVNPLCRANGLLRLGEEEHLQRVPLVLIPLEFQIDRVRNQVDFHSDMDGLLINPYLRLLLVREYGFSEPFPTSLDAFADELELRGFTEVDRTYSAIGNFHHHRYEILKELEELQEAKERSHALELLLGETPTSETATLVLGPELLFPADGDHRHCFELFKTNDIVVQGPPGTGKSQLLSNFIGKSLLSGRSVLAVSEKRSALEVIFQKLESVGLKHLGFISTPDLSSRDFLQSLRESWEYFEREENVLPKGQSIRKELEDNLQFTLDLLNQPDILGGIDYADFRELALPYSIEKGTYLPVVPPLSLVAQQQESIRDFFHQGIHPHLGAIRYSIYQTNSLEQLATALPDLQRQAGRIHALGYTRWGDFEQLTRKALVCTLFDSDIVNRYSNFLMPDSRAQKQFVRLSEQYLKLSLAIQQSQLSEWLIQPSTLELTHLKERLAHAGFFSRWRLRKRWASLNRLPLHLATESILALQAHYQLQEELRICLEKLAQSGIHEPDQDIPQLRLAIPLFTKEKWELYNSLSPTERSELSALSDQLDRFRSTIRHYFLVDDDTRIPELLEGIKTNFSHLVLAAPTVKQLDAAVLESIQKSSDFHRWMTDVLHTHYTRFGNLYPQLARFSGEQLREKVGQLVQAQWDEQPFVSSTILFQAGNQFRSYQELLVTPAAKLTAEQKELKKELRRGKSILVKAFSKTRHFPSLRELMASEARLWIRILKPVWLTNPVQLARSFPMEPGIFDLCIFDEASQIPLQHALGAVQRSKRILIAGDDQQMGPGSYFKAGSGEVTSLLQQANYYLKSCFLKHHYRSRYPELIAFSNKHFYKNELLVFPAYPASTDAIRTTFVADGIFENRRNRAEARSIALTLSELLPGHASLGIVAFSQEQADCIREHLSPGEQLLLEERIEAGTAFLKPLEKVQGDECEELVISLGYAPDPDGNFALRFGPLNRVGGRNRLNVLFTRASQRIHFFASVTAAHFPASDNESINLLRDWLFFLEAADHDRELLFPYSLHPKSTGNELHLTSIYRSIPSAVELSTCYQVLTQRGWKLIFER